HGAEEDAERHDPQQRHRLLERGAPVVAPPVAPADGPQVEGRLEGVVHVHPYAEHVRERRVAAVQPQRLDAEGGGEDVRDDRHGAAAPWGAGRRPATHTKATPTPIQTRSRSRLTSAA